MIAMLRLTCFCPCQCSASCEGGIKERRARCVDEEGRELDDSECDANDKVTTISCNSQPCPDWQTGNWLGVRAHVVIIIIIRYIYHALTRALSAHMIHIHLKYDILYTRRAQFHHPHKRTIQKDKPFLPPPPPPHE